MDKNYTIFDIKFIDGRIKNALRLLSNGGLMVAPAAPALVEIKNNPIYYRALLVSDFAIPDSGFMVLVLKYLKGIKIQKLSGVEFLRGFIEKYNNSDNLFLVDPNINSVKTNNEFLRKSGINISRDNHYVAPIYEKNKIVDPKLLEILEIKRPKYIMINLGGGVQEPLGLFIKEHISYNPSILCTGAAIAILNGQQAPMPKWVDKLYLGWLVRCIFNPRVFIPRYLKGFKLLPLLLTENIIIEEES